MRKRPEIVLFTEERKRLEHIVRSPTSQQRMVQRAKILLMSTDMRLTNSDIASRLEIGVGTVSKWQQRYLRHGIDGLEDTPRSGRPSHLSTLQRAEVIAIACDRPLNYGHELHDIWTLDLLTDTVNAEVEGLSISRSTVQRTLARHALKPHKTQCWLHSKDPEFKEKTNAIVELYQNQQDDSVTICVDEKPIQVIERKNETTPALPGQPGKKEYEYIRRGTRALIAGFNIHSGNVIHSCGDTRKSEDILAFMEQVALHYEDATTIHIVWDNLNIHHDGPTERWSQFNQAHGGKFVFHYTPIHASWVNQVEILFAILERRILRHGSYKSKAELQARLRKFFYHWNTVEGHPFNWGFQGFDLRTHSKGA